MQLGHVLRAAGRVQSGLVVSLQDQGPP